MTGGNIWSRFITARQLTSNYYIISTYLTDILYCYSRNSSIFNNLSQTLFSSSIDQIKLLNDYSNILQNILNHIHTLNAKDQLINTQEIIYDLIYIIEFDRTLHSILNVYQRQDIEFVIADGINISNRQSTIDSQGKFLTLWMSQKLNSHTDKTHTSVSQSISSSLATTLSEGTSNDDTLTDIYLTLLHSTNTDHSDTLLSNKTTS
ncbi:unnamed protein product [Rotaria sordida]|uniref:Uncharacterized protein n=1 Tax=Rotaria sordida TaxID=392033 RepID=A0A814V5B9_9BILA|nr:unnamed protein product [Rotaria sordida]CAF3992421.1 unnamed protein product [Rotaria sordida]